MSDGVEYSTYAESAEEELPFSTSSYPPYVDVSFPRLSVVWDTTAGVVKVSAGWVDDSAGVE